MDKNNQKKLLLTWYARSKNAHRAQYHSAAKLRRIHHRLGVPAAILSFIAGSGYIGAFAATSGSTFQITLQISSIIISFLAGILAALQTFLKLETRAQNFTIYGARFSSISKEIEQFLAQSDCGEIMECRLDEMRKRWDRIAEEAPTALSSVWKKLKKKSNPKITDTFDVTPMKLIE